MKLETLTKHGLKITPQRIALWGALKSINGHPTAECIIDFIRKNHPHIAVGTVYKTLDTFVEKGLVKKVKTDRDVMRYELTSENHHHLYCIESDRIEDYHDSELNTLLEEYFAKKSIPNFSIEDIRLQISGNFTDKKAK